MAIHTDVDTAVIGGLGLDLDGLAEIVETPYGKAQLSFTRLKGRRIVFVSRHGEGHLPPHKVNYRALIWALRSSGVSRIISTNSVGGMSHYPPGSFFIPNDFVEFTRSRPNTFFDDRAVHVDMSVPYCPDLRLYLRESLKSMGLDFYEGVYVCTQGPHLESPAQIRMMRQFGDVVGMTGYPEMVLARELGVCYASLCIVTNEACGLKSGCLSISEIDERMKECTETVREVLSATLQRIPQNRTCSCKDACDQSRL